MSAPLPLSGWCVVSTRPSGQSRELAERLGALGAEVVLLPCIAIEPPGDRASLPRALGALSSFSWVLFTSANGARAFCALLDDAARRALAGVRLGAVGRATARALEEEGLSVEALPTRQDGAALAALVAREEPRGVKILLVRAEEGLEELGQLLTEAGAQVTVAPAYRTVPLCPDFAPLVARAARALRIAILFASPSAARAFTASLEAQGARQLIEGAVVVAIGPTTARALDALGLEVTLVAEEASAEGLATALASLLDHLPMALRDSAAP